MQDFQAFTTRYKNRTNVLKSDISVSTAFDPDMTSAEQSPQFIKGIAIWDTGASCSVITKEFANKLGLLPTGKTQVNGVNHSTEENTYLVNILLPNSVTFMFVRIVEAPGIFGADFLVGMDIIGMGDYSVFTEDEKTVMSFRVPSIGGQDYVGIAEKINRDRIIQDNIKNQSLNRREITQAEKDKRRKKKNIQKSSQKKNRKH